MEKVDGVHPFMFVDVLSQVDVSELGKQVALFDRASSKGPGSFIHGDGKVKQFRRQGSSTVSVPDTLHNENVTLLA